ncbi:MFS transporter [Fusibacter bizertensis]|uniref:MFS transporter n=1 Tax=Fusibacter bizertensis TaxID=1488331 RepID=A0ABT6NH87_9FIRM|nr:MFS transporter [Fusibacter bizertensis]MDH8679772.1 MFS transporter [Fusibacter bizertensis]
MSNYQLIKDDLQVKKFCMYGFFKNLKFFEPYLLIYLLGMGLNLFETGLLFAIREGITYVFEVPSGIIADHYGKKKELLICFAFYIISFVFFFYGEGFPILAIAMIFFGLGEAFRSGTHKAMILSYLEHKGWYEHKGYVYGRTRSFSLLGSSLSAFLSILFVLQLPALRWIFLICIIPYLLDFLLIMSYPDFLDERRETEKSIKAFWKLSILQVKSVFKNNVLNKVILSASSYDGIFKTIKDYIQPILSMLLLAAGAGAIFSLDGDQSLKIYLGLIYGVFYIFSSYVSKNIYKLTKKWNAVIVFERLYDMMGILLIFLAIAVFFKHLVFAIGIYFVLYLLMDARRPVFVDVSSDYMDREHRATVLSIESQFKALFMVIFSPVFGFIADQYSISVLFFGIGVLLLIANRFLSIEKVKSYS